MDKRTLPKKQNEALRMTIRNLKQEGKTFTEISKIFGFSRQRAQQLAGPTMKAAKLIKASGLCDRCVVTARRLEIHHISYVPEITINLCNKCHRTAHKKEVVMETKQINFQISAEDAEVIDALADKDGIWNRSAWVRAQLRPVIDARKAEVAAVVNPVIRAQA